MNPAALQAKNETATAQEIILEQMQIIDKKSTVIEYQKKRILILEEYLRLAKQKQFGRSSETHPGQGEIFNGSELAACATEEEPEEKDDVTPEDAVPQKKRGRKGFSSNIPREQVRVDLSDEDKEGAIDTFYVKTKEELDIIPAKVRILEYMQEKAVFVDADERSIKVATMPKHPIGKVMASIGLLAYIIISKYMDGLPLHRLEKILQRYGGNITRTSMASWIISLSVQCQPLIHLIRSHQHRGHRNTLKAFEISHCRDILPQEARPSSAATIGVGGGGGEQLRQFFLKNPPFILPQSQNHLILAPTINSNTLDSM